jgi:hypothetical protein
MASDAAMSRHEGRRVRPWRALCCSIVSLALLIPGGAVGAPLKPDLVTLDEGKVRLCQEMPAPLLKTEACTGRGRTVLRVPTFIGNAGQGPLEYVPAGPAEDFPADCHDDGNPDIDGDGDADDNDVVVQQRIYDDVDANGVFTRSVDTTSQSVVVACRYFHAAHDHYHVEAFAGFLLRNEQTGQSVGTGSKVSFCVSDSGPFDLSLPGAQQPSGGIGYYRGGCRRALSIRGVSVGWYDTYGWNLPGQEIDVTGLPAGYYCVIVQVDPEDRLDETDETDNVRYYRTYMNPAAAPVNSKVTLQPATGGCASL